VGRVRVAPRDRRNIAKANEGTRRPADDSVPHLLDVVVGPVRLHIEPSASDVDTSRRYVGRLAADGAEDARDRQLKLRQPSEVELHLDLACREAPGLGASNAGHCFQPLLQSFGEILQLEPWRSLRYERDLRDVDVVRPAFANGQAREVRRKIGPERVHLPHDLVVFAVCVHRHVELDEDDGQSIPDRRLHILEVLERVQPLLDFVDDQLLEIRGVRSGVNGDDREVRRGERRVLAARDRQPRRQAEHGEHGEDQNCELVVLD
jgi:hypothetical protein